MRNLIFALLTLSLAVSSLAFDEGYSEVKLVGEIQVSFNTNFNAQDEVFPGLFVGEMASIMACNHRFKFERTEFNELYNKNPNRFSMVLDFSMCDIQNGEATNHHTKFYVYQIGDAECSFKNLESVMDTHFDEIDIALQNGENVLIACQYGMSRSVTATILYLMEKKDNSVFDAYYNVKKKRKIILPNGGFFKALLEKNNNLNKETKTPKEDLLTVIEEDKIPDAVKKLPKNESLEIEIYRYYWDLALYLKAKDIPFKISKITPDGKKVTFSIQGDLCLP